MRNLNTQVVSSHLLMTKFEGVPCNCPLRITVAGRRPAVCRIGEARP